MRCPNAIFAPTARYEMQVKLDAAGVEFTKDDDALVFKLAQVWPTYAFCQSTIIAQPPKADSTPPEVVTTAVISVRPNNIVNFKTGGNVQQSILVNQEELSKQDYAFFKCAQSQVKRLSWACP